MWYAVKKEGFVMKKALILLICLTALSGCKNSVPNTAETTTEQISAAAEAVTSAVSETEQTSEKETGTINEETKETEPAETVSDHRITREEAKTAAFDYSGLYETETCYGAGTTFYYEEEIPVIEVYFSTKYDYDCKCKVNASDGNVIDFSRLYNCIQVPEEVISPEEAEAAALEHAKFSADEVTFAETERVINEIRDVYSVKFTCGGTEYEYYIHSVDGDIIKSEIDEQGD